MNYLFYGYYPLLYEEGRTALLRKAGISNKYLEENGVMLPALSMDVDYIKPAYYDELLTIKTELKKVNGTRIHLFYSIWNEQHELINEGNTCFCCIDATSRKPIRIPDWMLNALKE
jgi:acyl-CoA thioester hydrolase